jgi:hypothetical protein
MPPREPRVRSALMTFFRTDEGGFPASCNVSTGACRDNTCVYLRCVTVDYDEEFLQTARKCQMASAGMPPSPDTPVRAELVQRAEQHDAGVVDQHIGAAQLLADAVGCGHEDVAVGDVGLDGD